MDRPLGVILAGGLARRMGGGDKSLLSLGASSRVLDQVIARLGAQVDQMVLNANGCLLYTSPSPRDLSTSRMPSSA